MHLTRRGKRRLTVLVLLVLTLGVGAIGFKWFRVVQRERALAEARAVGLAAHELGDLPAALLNLSSYFNHVKDDLEVNLAFADARVTEPMPNGQHLLEGIDLYNTHCLKLLDRLEDVEDREVVRADILRHLLELYEMVGLRFELVQTADRMLEYHPESIAALSGKARALFVEREFDRARSATEQLIVLEPDEVGWRQLLLEIMRRNGVNDREILAQCDLWIQEYEGDGRFWLLKAGYLAPMGRIDEARACAREAATRGAGTLEVLQLLISLMDRLGLREEASNAISRASERFEGEQWVAEATVRRLWRAGRIDEALGEIEATEQQFSSLGRGLLRLKTLLLTATDRFDDARATLDELRAVGAGTESGEADVLWADAMEARLTMTQATWREALESYQRALGLQPNDAVLHLMVAEAKTLAGEYSLALMSHELAHARDPEWDAATVAYVDALLIVGRAEEAYRLAGALLNRTPAERRGSLIVLYARAYLAYLNAGGTPALTIVGTGRRGDLAEILEYLYEQNPTDPQIASLLTEILVRTRRPNQATGIMHEAMANDQVSGDVLLALADVSRRAGLGLEITLAQQAAERGGEPLRVRFSEAASLAASGKPDEGLHLIDEALRDNPEQAASPEVQRGRVEYLLSIGHEDGQRELADLARQFPESADVQTFVLSRRAAWEDKGLISEIIERQRGLLGARSQLVQLAEAKYLVEFQADDEAKLARAIMLISGVLDQSPESLAALSLMARVSLMGDHPSPERAIEHLERAVALYPGQISLYPRLVRLLQRQGRYEAAEHHLVMLGRFADRDPRLARTEMSLLQAQGDFEAALVRATDLVDESSGESEQLALAAMHARAGHSADAQVIYDRLIRLPNRSTLVITQAAEFYASVGRIDRGVELLQSLEPEIGAARMSMLIGLLYEHNDRHEQAGEWLHKAVALDPDLADARLHLARHFLTRKDNAKAQEQAMAGLRRDPAHAGLRTVLALSGFGLDGQAREDAVALMRDLRDGDDDLLAVLQLVEQVPVLDGRADPTEDDLQAALKLTEERGGFLPAWHLAVSLHAEAGRVEQALEIAELALRRFPAQPEPAEWATLLLIRGERWSEALVEAEEWRRRTMSGSLPVDVQIANILIELNRGTDAVAQLQRHAQRIILRRDDMPEGLATWLRALVRSGRADEAAELIQPLLAEHLRWRQLWIVLAESADGRRAGAWLEMVEPYVGTNSRLALRLGGAYYAVAKRTGDSALFDRAVRWAEEAERDRSLQTSALLLRGTIAQARGDVVLAERMYRQVLAAEPEQPWALNNLAYLLATLPDRRDEAMLLSTQALELIPNQPDLLDTHALVLQSMDRLDESAATLRQAWLVRPTDASIGLHLVEVLLEQQDYEQAGATLASVQRLLDEQPAPDEQLQRQATEALRTLEQARATVES